MATDAGQHAATLQEATRGATGAWQTDMAALFRRAKERFPDVVWALEGGDEVWGHKAIVYARAPPSFQTRYFSFRPQEDGKGLSRSAISLAYEGDEDDGKVPTMAAATVGGITRLTTTISPALFANELEYLYTGQGFGEAFEFLFDEQAQADEGLAAEDLRIDKLRKDLVFMWRSRLYSDVRIALVANGPLPAPGPDEDEHERQMPVFSSHRFILASRCQYFHTALLSWPSSKPVVDTPTLSLPSPPFTPASLHFTLGFIYTGTLVFSHRTYDLTTALALLLSANYLSIPTLHTEVQARIVSEMAHGLFHAALPFAAYEALTGGAWRAGGCTCRKCAARVPRILEFALRPDVLDPVLERGARRALVGLFGPGWCTPEFAALPPKLHAAALKGLAKRTTPANALAILWAGEAARARLAPLVDAWTEVVKPLVEAGRSQVDKVMADQTAAVLAEADWGAIIAADGVRFEDGERVEWAMRSVVRGVGESNAGRVYQALVNVLLLPRAEGEEQAEEAPEQPLLAQTSHVRVQVEQAQTEVLAWIKRGGRGRADRVAREGGLDGVDGWAIREIADYLEIPMDDLLLAMPAASAAAHARQPTAATATAARKSAHLLAAKEADAHSLSIHTQQSSMRVSVLSKGIPTPRGARSVRREKAEGDGEDGEEENDRPDSKLTPPEPVNKGKGRAVSVRSLGGASTSAPPSPTVAVRRPPVPSRAVPPSPRTSTGKTSPTLSLSPSTPKSKYARSVASVSVSLSPAPATTARPRSAASTRPRPTSAASNRTTSTVKTTATTTGKGGLRPPPSPGRVSRASTASSTTGEFRTATARSRSRQSSVSSRHTTAGNSPVRARTASRTRTVSVASDASVRTTGTAGAGKKGPPSVRSVANSVTSGMERETAASAARKAAAAAQKARSVSGTSSTSSAKKVVVLKQRGRPATEVKEKEAPKVVVGSVEEKEHRKTESTASTASVGTLRGVKRRGSGDTVATVVKGLPSRPSRVNNTPPAPSPLPTPATNSDTTAAPLGISLDIGIACIVSTKRKRFKAYARYIGEVAGEAGAWVGVEVPAGTAQGMPASAKRQWCDGSWGGVRYFELGMREEEEEGYGDESYSGQKRRRAEASGGGTVKGNKRAGELLGGSRVKRLRSVSPAISDTDAENEGGARGLFVRPSAVLYVVDAVGEDL
ncbi:hypothetical protein MIND_00388500 [Mycena indigotica]|uniref:BTB domain-containing protein n=1 Tax=Mycena indigotica TaxID=2126181 RepID=A0A8H6T4L8_9AGAR|nr:uncharacterized protein MIND_00388500 [Mycena indigotica]KAF7310151.1 hypothetical protein MIND_00388500 [Mycena indigotica]